MSPLPTPKGKGPNSLWGKFPNSSPDKTAAKSPNFSPSPDRTQAKSPAFTGEKV